MDHTELRDYFKLVLNRNDCTDEDADKFISMGVRRVDRSIRTPLQKKTVNHTVTGTWSPIIIPNDYLSLISLRVDGLPIRRGSTTEFGDDEGVPTEFIFQNGLLLINPKPSDGSVVEFTYYSTLPFTPDEAGYSAASLSIPDLIIYAALVYASDAFVDLRKPDFEASYKQLFVEVQNMADADEMSGSNMVMTHPYQGLV